jgi:hypothetical protein
MQQRLCTSTSKASCNLTNANSGPRFLRVRVADVAEAQQHDVSCAAPRLLPFLRAVQRLLPACKTHLLGACAYESSFNTMCPDT